MYKKLFLLFMIFLTLINIGFFIFNLKYDKEIKILETEYSGNIDQIYFESKVHKGTIVRSFKTSGHVKLDKSEKVIISSCDEFNFTIGIFLEKGNYSICDQKVQLDNSGFVTNINLNNNQIEFYLSNQSESKVEFYIDQEHSLDIKQGVTEVEVEAGIYKFKSVINYIDYKIGSDGKIKADFFVDFDVFPIRDNLEVKVNVILNEKHNVIEIPYDLVFFTPDQKSYVLVKNKYGMQESREINIGLISNYYDYKTVEVISGLTTDDIIIYN